MTSWQVSDTIYFDGNFLEDSKNIIGFALAVWEGSKPAPCFEGQRLVWMIPVSREAIFELSDYPNIA